MLAEYDVAGLDYVDSDVGTMPRNPVTVIDIVGKHYAKLTWTFACTKPCHVSVSHIKD